MPPKTFRFNTTHIVSGTTFDFLRSKPTRTYDGVSVSAGVPRYDRTVSLLPASPAHEQVLTTGYAAMLMASGVNRAGTDFLWVVLTDDGGDVAGSKKLYIVNKADPHFNGTIFTDSNDFKQTTLTRRAPNVFDMMLGAESDRAYYPRAAVVVPGAVWVGCEVQTLVSGVWAPAGWALVRSEDEGANWKVYQNDLASPESRTQPRGAAWSAQNYFTPGQRQTSTSALLRAFLCFTDYRNNNPDILNPYPGGATVNILGILRPDTANGWKTDYENGTVVNKSLQLRGSDLGGNAFMSHVHCCGLLRNGNDLVLVISIGDTQRYNRLVKMTLARYFDPTLPAPPDYTVVSNWTINTDWHGSYDRLPGDPSDGDGQAGWQCVGMCQHPSDAGALLVGSDIGSNVITKLSIDANGKAKFEFVYGVNSSYSDSLWANPDTFVIRNPTPERYGAAASPAVAWFAQEQFPSTDQHYNRALLSWTGGADSWSSVARADQASANSIVARDPLGNWWLYIQSGVYLKRFLLSSVNLRWRPLLVGPGGRNFVRDNFDLDQDSGAHAQLTTILRSSVDGQFHDGATLIDPQPPTMINKLFKVRTVERPFDGSRRAGWFYMDKSGGVDHLAFARGMSTQRRTRVWVLDATKTLDRVKTTIYLSAWSDHTGRLPPPTHDANGNRTLDIVARDRWFPNVYSGALFLDPIVDTLATDIYSATGAGGGDIQLYYVAPEFGTDGEGTPGYPLPPDDGSTVYPNESATIRSFATGENFTLLLAGMMGDSTWDHCFDRTNKVYDLCTWYKDADNYIKVSADTANFALKITIRVGGITHENSTIGGWYWTRDSALLLGLSYTTSGTNPKRLTIVASLGGGFVQTATIDTTNPLAPGMNELRFRDAATNESDATVHECRWIGGSIDETNATDVSGLQTQLETLAFLTT